MFWFRSGGSCRRFNRNGTFVGRNRSEQTEWKATLTFIFSQCSHSLSSSFDWLFCYSIGLPSLHNIHMFRFKSVQLWYALVLFDRSTHTRWFRLYDWNTCSFVYCVFRWPNIVRMSRYLLCFIKIRHFESRSVCCKTTAATRVVLWVIDLFPDTHSRHMWSTLPFH